MYRILLEWQYDGESQENRALTELSFSWKLFHVKYEGLTEKPPLCISHALFILFIVICAMRIMSALHAETFINALKNESDMEENQETKPTLNKQSDSIPCSYLYSATAAEYFDIDISVLS